MKQRSKQLLRTVKPSPLLVGLLYLAVASAVSYLDWRITGVPVETYTEALNNVKSFDAQSFYELMTIPGRTPTLFGNLLSTALGLVSMVVSAGFAIYCLRLSRGEEGGPGMLLDGFSHFFPIVWLSIVQSVIISVAYILIIPGILLSYAYRQALYLLLDHPDWRISDCLRQSRMMMKGHKWELFVLDISFFGWVLLSAFPPVLIYSVPLMEVTYAQYYNGLLGQSAPGGDGDSYRDGEKPPWEY